MDDGDVLHSIEQLVDEEHELFERRARGELRDEGHQQLRLVETHLDQCWDLLRRRRAFRGAGADPNAAEVRPASVVERYQQ